MKTLATILKPYLRPLPLRPDKYLFQKDAGKGIISIQLKKLKHPVLLRKNTTDIPTFNEVFYWGEYAFDIPKAPDTIVDCGANIGLASVYFANRFPNAKIIAIEPEQSNFEMLQKNAAPYPNITCLQYGIWNRTTHLEIKDSGYGNWAFTTEEVPYKNEHTIEAISIDEIIKRYNLPNIGLLKIDIEGSEKEVFDKNTELWLPKVKTLIIELHDRYKRGCSKNFYQAIAGYDYVAMPKGANTICYFDVAPSPSL